MKKNLYLLGILGALLFGTYVFQEVRMSKNFEESLTKDHLVKSSDILKLKFNDVEAVKKENGQWWAGDKLLSHNTFNQLQKKLSMIKKIKDIEGDEKNFFTNPFPIEVNGELWKIGDLTLDRQGFYIYRNGKIMVAIMEGDSQEMTEDPNGLEEKKINDLKGTLDVGLATLGETQLFRYYPKLPLGSVTIESDGRPTYSLDFLNNRTIPQPIKGIQVVPQILQKFNSLVTQVTIKQEVPFDENLKFFKVAQIIFKRDQEEVLWELWLKSDNSADSYIIDAKMKKAWLMVGGSLRLFFLGPQDYWDKKVIPHSAFQRFNRLPVTFSQGSKQLQFDVINREPLDFEAPNGKIDREKMNILFQYLFNLSEKDQADRVSQLSSSERKEILTGNFLHANVMGQDIVFWRKLQELIVVNLTQGFKAHFLVKDESFRANFEDVIKLSK